MSGQSSNLGRSGSGGVRVRRDGVSPAQALLRRQQALLRAQAQVQGDETRAKAKEQAEQAKKLASRQGARTPLESRGTPQIPTLVATTLREIPRIGDGTGKEKNIRLRSGPSLPAYLDPKATKAFGSGGSVQFVLVKSSSYDVSVWVPFQVYGDKVLLLQGNGRSVELPLPSTGSGNSRVTDMSPAPVAERVNQLIRQGKFNISGLGQAPDSEPMGALYVLANTSVANGKRWSAYLDALPDSPKKTALQTRLNQILRGEITGGIFSGTASVALTYEAGGPAYRLGVIQSMIDLGEGSLNMLALQPPGTIKVSDLHRERQRIIEEARKNGIDLGLKDGDANNLSNQFRTEDPETRALYDRGRSDGQAMLLGVAGGAFSLKVLLPRASLRTSSNAGTYLRLKEIEIGGRRVVVPIDSRDNIIPVRELQRRGGRQWEAYQRDIKGGAPVVPNSPTAALEFANALYGGKYSVIGLIGENNIVPFVRRGPSGGGGPSVDGGRGGGGLSTMLGQGPVRVETMSVGALEQTRGGSGLSGGVALKQLNAQLASSPELVAALPKLKPGQGFTTIVGDGSGGFFVATVTSLGVRGEVAVTLDDWERSGTLGSRPPTVRVTLSGNAGSPLSLASTQPQPLPSIGSNTRIDVADLGKTATGIRMAWALASAQQNSVTLAKLSAGEPVYFSDGGKAEPVSGGNVKFTLNTGEYYVAPYNKDTRQFTLPAAVRRLMPVPTAGGSTGQQQLEQVGTQLDDIRQDTAQVQQRLNNSVANIEQQMTQAREDFNRRSDEIQRAIAAENERLAEARARSIETAKQTEAINKQEWEATMGCLNHPLTRAARKRVTGEDTRFDPQTAQMIPGSADRKRFKNFNVVLVQTLETLFPGRRLPEIYGYLKTHPSDLKRVLDIVEAKVREQPGSVSRVQALNVSQEAVLNAGPRDVAKLRLRDAINAYASGQRGNLPGGVIAAERAPGALDFIDPGTGVWTSVKFKDNTTDAILWDPPGSTSSTLPSSATQVPRRTYAERIKALREALDIKGQDAFTQGVMKRLDEGLRASAKERDISIDQAVNAFVRDVGPNGEVQSKKAASLRLLKQVQAQLKTNPGGLDKEQVQRVQEAIGQEWVKRLNDPDAGIDFLRSMTDPAARGAFIEKHKGEPAAAVRPTTGDPANPTGLPTAPPPQTVTPANPNVVPTPVPAEVPTGAPLNPDPPAIQALPKELRERLRDYGLGTKTRDEALERLTPAQQKKLKEAMDALDKLDKAAKGAPIQSPQEIAQKGPLSEVEKIRWLRKMQSAAEAQTISDYRSGKKTREEALKGLKGKSRARVAEAIDAIDRTKLAWGPGGGVAVPEYKPLALAAAINSSVKDNHYGYLNLDAGTIEAMKRSLENALKENPSPESKKSLERALATLNDQPAAAQRYNQGLDDFARALDREGVRSLPENLQPLVRDALHERLSSGKLDAATQRTYTRVIAALDAEIKGQGAAPARTAGEISAAQRQREKLLSEATEAVGATRRALNEASAAKKDIPTQVKKYGEAAEHIKKLQALETLARGQGEKQIADAIAVLHKALESERKAGFSTGPGAAQANANNDGKVWLGPKPQDVFEAPKGTWEINWNENLNINDGKVVMHLREGNAIDITSIWRGSQPPGAASRMITDCIRNIAGVQQPPSIRISRISENQPTIDALNTGVAPANTVLGKVLTGSSALLGAEIVGWKKGQDNGVWWIEAVLRYPAPNTIKPAGVVNADESPQRLQQITKRLEATRFDGKNITVRRIDDATAAQLGPNDLLMPGSATGNVTVRELMALTGGLNNSQIAVQRLNSNQIQVIIRSPGFDELEFTITRGPNGVKTARLDGISADTGVNQQLLIAQVFVLKFLSAAKAQGFESVGCYAHTLRRQDGLAWIQGYRAWPALGFDATIRDAGKLNEQGRPSRSEQAALLDAAKKFLTDNPQVARKLNLQPNQINENTRILDLMYDADGKPVAEAQLFWRRNGVSFQAQVDLNNPSSKSYRVFQNALRNFGITSPSAATEQSTRQRPNAMTPQPTGQAGGPPQYVPQASVSEQDHFQQLIARARSSAKDDTQRVRLDTVLTVHREKGWSYFAGRQALNAIIANPNISAAQAIKIGEANEYLINEVRAKFPVPSTLALNRVWTDVNAPGIENMEQARQLLAGIDHAERMLNAAFTGRADGVGPQARGEGTIFVWGGLADLLRSPIPIEAKLRKLNELANFSTTVITQYNSSSFGKDMGNSPTSYVYGGHAESGLFAGLGGATPREARERVLAKIDQLVASGRLQPIGTQENPGVNGSYNRIYYDTVNNAVIRVGEVTSTEVADTVGLPKIGDGNLGAPIDVSQSLYIPRLLSPASSTSLGLAVLVMANVGQPFKDVFPRLSPEKRKAALESLLDAVVSLHLSGRQHNDLHSSNFLCDEITGRCRIIDFGRIERRNPATAGDPVTIERYRQGSTRQLPFERDYQYLSMTLTSSGSIASRAEFRQRYRDAVNRLKPPVGAAQGSAAMRAFQEKREGLLRGIDRFY
jgi:hypothetical protein